MGVGCIGVHDGAALKFEAWLESAKFRTIPTAGSPILVQEGQMVAVIIIDKWDDVDVALDAIRKLAKGREP